MTTTVHRTSAAFMALADPTRRAILAQLAGGERTVRELAEPFTMTQQAVSQHLRVLEEAGLISRTKVRQSRPCRIEPAGFDPVLDWIEHNRRLWADRHDRLAAYLERIQDTPTGEDPTP
jgi:DNA-binding transcriptional ArsR family regulator